jgi:hypothetical protein
MFPTIEDAETALEQWMGDEFSETTKLALIKVSIPHTIEVFSDVPFECHVYDPIPPVCLSVQTTDIDSEMDGLGHLA